MTLAVGVQSVLATTNVTVIQRQSSKLDLSHSVIASLHSVTAEQSTQTVLLRTEVDCDASYSASISTLKAAI